MCKLTYSQKIAYKYYCAYGELCSSIQEGISGAEGDELRETRKMLFQLYKKYDPDNSFELRKGYDLRAGEVVSISST